MEEVLECGHKHIIIARFSWGIGSRTQVKVAPSCPTLCDPMDCIVLYIYILCIYSLGQNTGVGSLSLLWEIFPTQELNRGPLYCQQILYQLHYQYQNPLVLKSLI